MEFHGRQAGSLPPIDRQRAPRRYGVGGCSESLMNPCHKDFGRSRAAFNTTAPTAPPSADSASAPVRIEVSTPPPQKKNAPAWSVARRTRWCLTQGWPRLSSVHPRPRSPRAARTTLGTATPARAVSCHVVLEPANNGLVEEDPSLSNRSGRGARPRSDGAPCPRCNRASSENVDANAAKRV